MTTIVSKHFGHDFYESILRVEGLHEAKRLDLFVKDSFPSFSREFIKQKIEKKEITIISRFVPSNFKRQRASGKVYFGDHVSVKIFRDTQEEVFWKGKRIPEVEKIEILYEDSHLVVISKPPFMTTHPTGRHLFYCATVWVERQLGHFVHSVHRLDRETSGVLLLAKGPEAANFYTRCFLEGKIKKEYFFIGKVKGQSLPFLEAIFPQEFSCYLPLGSPFLGRKRVIVTASFFQNQVFKNAQTYFKILEKKEDFIFGLASPLTGRQHQIRVHAKELGFPLLGDKLYLKDYETFQRFQDKKATEEDYREMLLPRQALHAYSLEFPLRENPLKRHKVIAPIDPILLKIKEK